MVDFKISKLFKKEEPILHEKGFTIEKDVLFYRDSFILIRNISQVSVGPLPTPEFPKVAILMILIGLVLSVVIIGLIPLIFGCILIYNWYQEVQYNKRSKYLNITMNAGTTLSFVGSDIPFMDRVVSIIRDCANGKYNEQPIIVNMQGSQVSGSIFGPVTKNGDEYHGN